VVGTRLGRGMLDFSYQVRGLPTFVRVRSAPIFFAQGKPLPSLPRPLTDELTMAGAPFAMFTCQQGAEPALKADLLAQGWTLAFSRPGFLTVKATPSAATERLPVSPYARSVAWSLGYADAADTLERCGQVLALVGERQPAQFHVWQRDQGIVGRGFEPFPSTVAVEAREQLLAAADGIGLRPAERELAARDATVLDVVIVDERRWWVGWHITTEDPSTRWPGGVPPLARRTDVVSRAYYKFAEAIAWSEFPLKAEDHCAEIGCAPGGASQFFLEQGLRVIGIDPGDVDARIAEHARFRHIRARGGDLPRRTFRDCKWLFVDSNVAPDKSLTTVEHLVTNANVRIRGLIVQLKLSDYEHGHELPKWLARVSGWGYGDVAARQLAFNRRELTLRARWPRASRRSGSNA